MEPGAPEAAQRLEPCTTRWHGRDGDTVIPATPKPGDGARREGWSNTRLPRLLKGLHPTAFAPMLDFPGWLLESVRRIEAHVDLKSTLRARQRRPASFCAPPRGQVTARWGERLSSSRTRPPGRNCRGRGPFLWPPAKPQASLRARRRRQSGIPCRPQVPGAKNAPGLRPVDIDRTRPSPSRSVSSTPHHQRSKNLRRRPYRQMPLGVDPRSPYAFLSAWFFFPSTMRTNSESRPPPPVTRFAGAWQIATSRRRALRRHSS